MHWISDCDWVRFDHEAQFCHYLAHKGKFEVWASRELRTWGFFERTLCLWYLFASLFLISNWVFKDKFSLTSVLSCCLTLCTPCFLLPRDQNILTRPEGQRSQGTRVYRPDEELMKQLMNQTSESFYSDLSSSLVAADQPCRNSEPRVHSQRWRLTQEPGLTHYVMWGRGVQPGPAEHWVSSSLRPQLWNTEVQNVTAGNWESEPTCMKWNVSSFCFCSVATDITQQWSVQGK